MKEDQVEAPVVTEDDVLAGEKQFEVRTRKGETVRARVRAMPWRTALQVSSFLANGQAGEATIAAVQHALVRERGRDEFLDSLVPEQLTWIARVAMELTNGVDQAKKLKANSAPDSATGSPSSAS